MMKKIVALFAFSALLLMICFASSLTFVSCKKQEPAPPPPPAPLVTKAPALPSDSQSEQSQVPASNVKQTEMAFTEEIHDFGTINQGDAVNHFFTFKNTGTNDLMITRALGSCGCTVPDFPKEPIAPGKTGKMKVTFNSAGKSGPQEKTVTVFANVPNGTKIIKVKADIKVK